MEAIPEKTEVKSDFEFDYCGSLDALVDKKYCEFECELMQKNKIKKSEFGL